MDNIERSIEKVSEFVGDRLCTRQSKTLVTGKLFITGGKGIIGYRVALRLLNSGYPSVRVGFRQPDDECAQELSKKGAEVADFCWTRESTYASALQGVKIVFCVTPYIEGWAKYFPAFLEACEKAGVQYFVKVSFYHSRRTTEPYHRVQLVSLHAKCDELLSRSAIPWTILSASHFMSNPLVMHHLLIANAFYHVCFKPTTHSQDKATASDQENPVVLYGSADGKNINYLIFCFISPNDIAEVAARVLLYSKPHMGKEYTLTGIRAISDDDVTSAISRHACRPVFYEDLPIQMFVDREKGGGEPHWKVRDLVGLEKIKATGLEEDLGFVSHDIEKICKREPETFDDYLEAKQNMTPMESWLVK
ncbi:hypothetical protein ACHAWF_017197 [Thalassiosira exigua]